MPPVSPFPVYVGFDPRESIAYDVCRHSILSRTRADVAVVPLVQNELRERKLYWRTGDPLASTEFTYTRFLVPALAGYQGWALYCDCDFLWLADIADLFALADDRYAAMCVHHDHRPTEAMKMDGRVQTLYPRKNWSSLILWNCAHPANAALTPDVVNRETGAFLHRFSWLKDKEIGAVPETWNWLEGWSARPASGPPKVVHYTRGGPWFDKWEDVAFADLWLAEAARLHHGTPKVSGER
ncbi:MAG TPA: glycosyltransferase [Alphaproteobacteria bacterium]|nr:glycosyltransferase [Alphaproteobacteria bacterium]